MILPRPEDATHRMQLYRLLTAILDDQTLSKAVYFKGGTCAAMLNLLDRFSVDLDFDLKVGADPVKLDQKLSLIFDSLDYRVSQKSPNSLYYVLKYESQNEIRNTLKLSIIDAPFESNVYKPEFLAEIDRYAICQTKETMFANKLVAVTDRYVKHQTIAGRDIYDIHYFFLQRVGYQKELIKERTGKEALNYFRELHKFIEDKVTDKVINEDLSFLLPPKKFQLMRKVLKKEVLSLISNEISSLS